MSLIAGNCPWIKEKLGVKPTALCGYIGLRYNSLAEKSSRDDKRTLVMVIKDVAVDCDKLQSNICHINRRLIVQLGCEPFVTTGHTTARPGRCKLVRYTTASVDQTLLLH